MNDKEKEIICREDLNDATSLVYLESFLLDRRCRGMHISFKITDSSSLTSAISQTGDADW